MFKTFRHHPQTHQGEFPLTPRYSCCLLALMTFPHLNNWGIAGLVVTAIATTGLGAILVLKKNRHHSLQIPQPLENLEKPVPVKLNKQDAWDREEQIRKNQKVSIYVPEDHLDYSPDAIKKRLIERYNNNKPKKQDLSWEENSKLLKMMIEDAENESEDDYTPEEIAALNRIQKRLEAE